MALWWVRWAVENLWLSARPIKPLWTFCTFVPSQKLRVAWVTGTKGEEAYWLNFHPKSQYVHGCFSGQSQTASSAPQLNFRLVGHCWWQRNQLRQSHHIWEFDSVVSAISHKHTPCGYAQGIAMSIPPVTNVSVGVKW